MAGRSFCTSVTAPDGLGRPLAAVRAEVATPAGGVVFVSGALAQELDRVAEQVKAAWRNVPVAIVPAAGVITERGEIEGASAACGLLWPGGKATPFAVGDGSSAAALREVLTGAVGSRPATALLFPRSDFAGELLEGLTAGGGAPLPTIFGGGTVGGPALVLTATGEVLRGRAAGLVLHGLAPPLVEASAACRLLTPFRTIEETSGGLVLRIDGTPALDALSACMPDIRGAAAAAGENARPGETPKPAAPPVVFVALADPEGDRFVVRPVRGIDPTRRGVMVGPEVKAGARLAFAVRDAAAGRAGLQSAVVNLHQQARGSVPRFALYMSCAGRGQGLYGTPDVEARILRQGFGDLPIAGMHSAFEIVPWGPGEARLALYTGVLALFRSPS